MFLPVLKSVKWTNLKRTSSSKILETRGNFDEVFEIKDHAGYIKRSQKNIENDDEHQTLNNRDEEYI